MKDKVLGAYFYIRSLNLCIVLLQFYIAVFRKSVYNDDSIFLLPIKFETWEFKANTSAQTFVQKSDSFLIFLMMIKS